MRLALLVVAFLLFVAPSYADWKIEDLSTEEDGVAYKAWTLDVTGSLEAQIYCDDWFPGVIDLTLYTGETHDPNASYAEDGIMTVTLDDRRSIDVTAFFDEFEGELLIYTSNFDTDDIIELLVSMAEAERTIQFDFYGRSMTVPSAGLFGVLNTLADTCPAQ